jgi:putative sterol carrier protein
VSAPHPFTQRWADLLKDAINASDTYRAVAGTWTWPVVLVLDATPAFGYADPAAVRFELDRGTCTSARMIPVDDAAAPFVLRASYAVWKRVVHGVTDPVMAIALRQIKLQGSLSTLMLHMSAAKALIACARTVPTHFPDEEP